MDIKGIKKAARWVPVVYFPLVLLVSIVFLSEAARHAEVFSRWYGVLLTLVIVTILLLLLIIGKNFLQLLQRFRSRELGSRLSMRLFAGFMLLTIVPATFIYLMSISFVQRSIDSWFDSELENTLSKALDQGQQVMALHHGMLQAQLEKMVLASQTMTAVEMQGYYAEFPWYQQPHYLASYVGGKLNRILQDQRYPFEPGHVLPDKQVMQVLRRQESVLLLDYYAEGVPYARIFVPLSVGEGTPAALIALFVMDRGVGELSQNAQQAFAAYQQLKFSREPLKASFVLTLSLALLQAVLTATWAALFFANRLVVPIRALAVGTREVAVGQYGRSLEPVADEEMNTLIQSFNDMTSQVERAQDDARRNQNVAEAQRLYLQTVMSRLSSGVMTFDTKNFLLSSNSAADKMLGEKFRQREGDAVGNLFSAMPEIMHLVEDFFKLNDDSKVLRQQIELSRSGINRMLMVSISRLPSAVGWVMVVDDITRIVEAQRQQAWGEVARRMAHEIKNPLTPIQLSAERLRHKYMAKLPAEEADSFDRLVSSIIVQVDSMKELLQSFSDYTRLPEVHLVDASLNDVVSDVLTMYRDVDDVKITTQLAPGSLACPLDRLMVRQVLHNLLKNALYATREAGGECITVTTLDQSGTYVVNIEDEGGGIDPAVIDRVFDPYFTTRAKGTGLGLAIARKIMQEHGGDVVLDNRAPDGSCFQLRFPAHHAGVSGLEGENQREQR